MFEDALNDLAARNLFRSIWDRESAQGRVITINGEEFINFSSNDYLGLASHKVLASAVVEAIDLYGTGAGASRLLSGGTVLHSELESKIASFKGCEKALLFNTGYSANVGVIPALALNDDLIFSDELNHASIIDGCRLSRAEVFVYRHNDTDHLESLMRASKGRNRFVVTESVFSMDGDIAPLDEVYSLCRKHNAMFYIDDAHAFGVLGEGRGGAAHFGLPDDDSVVQMGTLSKALGSVGAYVAASKVVINYLINCSRSLIYSTALSVCDIAASIAALDYFETHPELTVRLNENVIYCRQKLLNADFLVKSKGTPVIPVCFKSVEETLKVSSFLLERGVYAPAIRPPTVKQPRIRISLTSSHTTRDMDRLVELLVEARQWL